MKVSKELIKLIELMVKKEVKSAINEIKVSTKPRIVEREHTPTTKPTGRSSIAQALQETYDDQTWKSMGGDQPYDTSRMGEILNKQYSDMGQGAAQPVDIATQTAAAENVQADAMPESLRNALNKDYSELVKRFDEKVDG